MFTIGLDCYSNTFLPILLEYKSVFFSENVNFNKRLLSWQNVKNPFPRKIILCSIKVEQELQVLMK